MGSFSWLRANVDTEKANIACGDKFACLIPKEFGGGYIEDTYQDYGNLGTKEDGSPKYDLYELLAFWNNDRPYFHLSYTGAGKTVKDNLYYNGDFPNLKEIDEFTDANRSIGIDIGCYDREIDRLKYPLKLVSVSYAKNHTYEDCPYKSFGDTEQGFCSYNWIKLTEYKTEFTSTAHIPQGYADLIRGRIRYLEEKDNFNKWEEIGALETFLDECVIENPNIERLKNIKKSLNDAQSQYFSDWLSEAKELCKKEGIDFKNFLEHDDFDSKQPDKKIKKNIEKDL
jgi:hypothetical protein